MRVLIACLLLLLVGASLPAAGAEPIAWQGARLIDLIDSLNEQGLRIIYSSDLVGDELIIAEEPDLAEPRSGLAAALAPFALSVSTGPSGSLLIVRDDALPASAPTQPAPGGAAAPLPEIVVTSSLHRLEFLHPGTHRYLDRELATRIPAAAEEAVRITTRLPGTAGGGISARSHVRGGEANEVLFLLDGLRLYEPFHLKDFQSIATIVNSNAIAGIDFYTGAYPARYGDRMSGVMSIGLREAQRDVETELALSFFNASALSLGRFGDDRQGDWLVAARRGNLDLVFDVVDPERGSPDYRDFLLHGGWSFGDRADISVNYLLSVDKIQLADTARGEVASAKYDNEAFWLKWIANWNDALTSTTVASFSSISNRRIGSLNLTGIVLGSLDDWRDFRAYGFKQDWTFAPRGQWMLSFGIDAKHLDGNYRFSSTRTVSEPFDAILDNTRSTVRDFDIAADGAQYAAYAEIRWQPNPHLALDIGVRRDHQNYTTPGGDAQTSPRASLLFNAGENTELRLGWGQFSQAQEVNELQISDGVADYFAAQRAEHVVANVQHHFRAGIDLTLSLYRKSFREVRPRFENAFNSLTIVPEIQFDRYRIDASSAQSRGAEIMLSRGSAQQAVLWWLSYSWSEVRDSVATGKLKRSWDQSHTGKAGISWRWKTWDFSAAAEVHTGWPRTELMATTGVDPDGSAQLRVATTELNSRQYSAFHTLDARVSRDFAVKRGSLTVFLEITNLYDHSNTCCIEYTLQTETDGTKVLQSRETHWLPLVPSLGVIWRF
ncbi:MAG: TonB-dependent receptor [Gammaproteobacteria bacterium]|nr:TonB-dependent receptor [Gammaproteobacteria bacterium]